MLIYQGRRQYDNDFVKICLVEKMCRKCRVSLWLVVVLYLAVECIDADLRRSETVQQDFMKIFVWEIGKLDLVKKSCGCFDLVVGVLEIVVFSLVCNNNKSVL